MKIRSAKLLSAGIAATAVTALATAPVQGSTLAASAATTAAAASECQTTSWCTVPTKKGIQAAASVIKNDHDVLKAVGKISIRHTGTKTTDKAYVSWRPSGSRFGVGRAAWTSGPKISPRGQSTYWWDYYYYWALQPYAFEFRICLSDAGVDTCGDTLKIKDPKNRPF